MVAGCQPPTGAPPPQPAPQLPASDKLPGWDALVEAAKREGEVSLYLAIPAARDVLTTPFETAYPGMKVSQTIAPNVDLVARILAEREAGKYLSDVIIGPASQSVLVLKPARALEPLGPSLVLPEVVDTSKWLDNRLWWIDATEPITTLSFQGYVAPSLSYNTQMVDPREFTSFMDLLNPKWRGQIVSNDIRRPGSGSTQVRVIWQHPDLGPRYIERLFSEMDIQVSSDHRQMIDWLGQGRYPLGLWLSSSQMRVAAEDGLPVKDLSAKAFRESAGVTQGGGTVNLAANAVHPNAAKLFINWFLSREGQMLWQREVETPSLRIDIPKDGLEPGIVPEVGAQYIDSTTEAFNALVSMDEIRDLVDRALARRG
ncbi:MAG: ABC-type Fe3+ transport system periplasmic component [Chloroflexi bacterium]|nr:ABC-type Fe3+ transport system periplasmic component [Chloroflexota bacterium]